MGRSLEVRRKSENLPAVSCTYSVLAIRSASAALQAEQVCPKHKGSSAVQGLVLGIKTAVPLVGTVVFLLFFERPRDKGKRSAERRKRIKADA